MVTLNVNRGWEIQSLFQVPICPTKLGLSIIHEEEENGLGWGAVTGSVCHSQLLFIELLLCTRCMTPFVHLILTTPTAGESYYPHPTGEETKTWRGQGTSPKLES